MTWLKTIALALNLITSLVGFLRERRQIEAGEAKAIAEALKEAQIRVEKARAARRAVTGGLPGDDPYLRD